MFFKTVYKPEGLLYSYGGAAVLQFNLSSEKRFLCEPE